MFLVALLTVGALTAAAHADKPAVKVNGKGIVTMTATDVDILLDPPAFVQGDSFTDNHFKIKGKVYADGSASGTADFVFGEEFSTSYEVDLITLKCEIDTGTVVEDGTVVLQGFSFEEDFINGVVVFEELSPFVIAVDPNGLFTLRWCQLPAYHPDPSPKSTAVMFAGTRLGRF